MKRRTFLKLAGAGGLSLAAGCNSRPENTLYALVQAPDDMVTGKERWYASTCRECPAGCGVIAKTREGRTIKIEGNPAHPVNRGKLCMRGQAALQGLYNPDRITMPLLRKGEGWEEISYSTALTLLRDKASAAAAKGGGRVRMATEVVGESLLSLFMEALDRWNSEGPLVFEPYAYESLREAHRILFGVDGLVSYRMERADLLVNFGADFMETWLSPVEYATKFKEMHALRDGKKGRYIHVAPHQSMTCASADQWLSCRPGGEAVVALTLLRAALSAGRGKDLSEELRRRLQEASAPWTVEKAAALSGVDAGEIEALARALLGAGAPLILGTGVGSGGAGALAADLAATALNLVLDPTLARFDFGARQRVELAARRSETAAFFRGLAEDPPDLLLLNNVDPVHALPRAAGAAEALENPATFVVAFTSFMTETAAASDLIFPVRFPLEEWSEYGGKMGLVSTLQPAVGKLTRAIGIGDVLLFALSGTEGEAARSFKAYITNRLLAQQVVESEAEWLEAVRAGGIFGEDAEASKAPPVKPDLDALSQALEIPGTEAPEGIVLMAVPSIRFFDGRGANRPWLCEIPDPLTKIAWQNALLVHPETLEALGMAQGDVAAVETAWGRMEIPVYETVGVHPGAAAVSLGQGHRGFGRYADGMGVNPAAVLPGAADPASGGPVMRVDAALRPTGRSLDLAHTDGSRFQHGRSIALSISMEELAHPPHEKHGLAMHEFPLTLPLPEGYSKRRDVYPPHDHETYRWAMAVDLDRCVGCGACAAACYAENNIGVVGLERMLKGREMSWLMVQRYLDPDHPEAVTFLPMLCQHCDNAPCESVCPVYAPHHSKEGLNNQIYNRCIGTRFCSQNCPYKVRRFNWFDWEWPEPLNLQLNPEVTVRSKGVMEKCSFCVQRIKDAHGAAADENREIRDGEVVPACAQTCPTGVFTFGNLMDPESRVRRMVADRRAYQVMGYLNTKPAVIYLKKVIRKKRTGEAKHHV